MSHVPKHQIDPKHFAKNFQFRRYPLATPEPWCHPMPTPATFDMLCREVKANVLNMAYSTEALKRNVRKIGTLFMGEEVYSFILPNGKELILGS